MPKPPTKAVPTPRRTTAAWGTPVAPEEPRRALAELPNSSRERHIQERLKVHSNQASTGWQQTDSSEESKPMPKPAPGGAHAPKINGGGALLLHQKKPRRALAELLKLAPGAAHSRSASRCTRTRHHLQQRNDARQTRRQRAVSSASCLC